MHRYCMFLVQSYIIFSLMTGTSTRKQQYSYFVKEWVSLFFGINLRNQLVLVRLFCIIYIWILLTLYYFWKFFYTGTFIYLTFCQCCMYQYHVFMYINHDSQNHLYKLLAYISVFDGLDFGVLLFFKKFIIKFRLKTSVRKLNSSCSIIKNYIISCTMCGCWVILF